MDDETYWHELEQESIKVEVTEYNYINEYINAGHYFTMNRIRNNLTGGKKSVEYL